MKGVMSDRDRCSIPLVALSSILKLVPHVSYSVEFHRNLLGVPSSSPFRQYTRLTVNVESIPQVQALNFGNPILKTYDLVAVKPLNQSTFEHACEKSEVDIIAIDFSEKLPFRLKLPAVKNAIKRGVYFEITYSGLIADVQTRRQMISNAKLLVDWIRGKNLILSSSASFANDLRGPYDVSNLAFLLGLSMELAKAAVSTNCRALLAKALRKKQFHKEAIRVEVMPSGGQIDHNKPFSGDWGKWDPISSGEGDLSLDDMVKSFTACGKVSENVKAIDFATVIDSLPSRGFQVKDLSSITAHVPEGPNSLQVNNLISGTPLAPTSIQVKCSVPRTEVVSKAPNSFQVMNFITRAEVVVEGPNIGDKSSPTKIVKGESLQSQRLNLLPQTCLTSGHDNSSEYEVSACENASDMDYTCMESGFEEKTVAIKEHKSPNASDVHVDEMEKETTDLILRRHPFSSESNVLLNNNEASPILGKDINFDSVCFTSTREIPNPRKDICLPVYLSEKSNGPRQVDAVSVLLVNGAASDVSLHEVCVKNQQVMEIEDALDLLTSGTQLVESGYEIEREINSPTFVQSISGKSKGRRTKPGRSLQFPFKRLLNPIAFKKKASKFKCRI